jgi:large subunit ribosomal protein L10
MNIVEKKQFVADLKSDIDGAGILLVAHYAGLTVDQVTKLRTEAKKNEVKVKVAKNSLAKLALTDTAFSGLQEELKGPTILIFATDIVAAAKILVAFAKENEQLVIKTGSYNESLIAENEIVNISKMASLDEIRAKLISLINAPAQKIACVLQAPAGQTARVINAFSQK